MNEMGLADAIAQLRREIVRAEASAKGETVHFTLGAVELELEVELLTAASAEAGFKWVVVSAGGATKAERTHTHRVKLTLNALSGGAPVIVSDSSAQEPE